MVIAMGTSRIYTNSSLQKALRILDLFSIETAELSVTHIARLLGVNPSSLYPILGVLTQFRYLEQNKDTKKYRLGIRLLEKSFIVLAQFDIRDRASPFLEELRAATGENVHLAILDEGDVVYIDRKETRPTLPIESKVGKRVPAYCTALGKVLLAWADDTQWQCVIRKGFRAFTEHTITDAQRLKAALEAVRAQGYAIDDEEFQTGGFCISAPLRDYRGVVVAAVSVSLAKAQADERRIADVTSKVLATAAKISNALGHGTVQTISHAETQSQERGECVDDEGL